MPKKINIKGEIIPNDYKWIYDLFDIENTNPGDVEKALKEANGEDIEVIINSPGGDVFSGEISVDAVKQALKTALKKVLEADEVPAANEIQCGNYRDMSLEQAQHYARQVLEALE